MDSYKINASNVTLPGTFFKVGSSGNVSQIYTTSLPMNEKESYQIVKYGTKVPTSITVSFDSNGGGPTPTAQTIQYGNAVTKPDDPAKNGYTFDGWYRNKALTTEWNFTGNKVGYPIILYAKWKEKANVTITYVSADTEKGTVNPASESLAPVTGTAKGSTAAANAGYHFVSWTNNSGSVVSTTPAFVLAKVGDLNVEATYTANFAPIYYMVFFVTNDGSTVNSISAGYRTTITKPIDPTKEGYTFNGWYKDPGMTTAWEFDTDTIPAENITLYARWKVNSFMVSFNLNGHGTAPADESVITGGLVTEPAAPSETGYTFGGWYKDPACTSAWNFASDKVNGNTTLYAKWTMQNSTASGSNANGSDSSDSGGSSTGGNTSGTWVKENGQNNTRWQFKKSDGTLAENTWVKTGNKWYHFDSSGYAQTGWVLDQGKWYHCDPGSCAMDTGLYHDNTDSHDYYLNADGSMATGWVTINGKQYYFNPNPVAATYSYDPVTQTWIWNSADVLPYGAMLKETTTPDGHHVDETGARID